MSDPDRPNWFKRLSSSTTTSLRSLGLPISPSTSPTSQSPSSYHEYEPGSMREKNTTGSSRASRQSSIRHFRPSRQSSSATSENSIGSSTQTDRPTPDRIRHTGSLQSIIQNPHDTHAHHVHPATRSNTHPQPHQHQVGSRSRSLRIPPGPRGPPLGPMSSPGFPNSLFHASEFMLGAGMVILQPSTARIVIVHETKLNYWFLPKGRKDVGESIEQAALREAYEESGYRAEFLPLYILTHAPSPPGDIPYSPYRVPQRNTEPIYLSTYQWQKQRWPQGPECTGGEYLTFWYVGQIPHDAVRERDTGMPDEVNYVSELVDLQTALQRLTGIERNIVMRAYELWAQDADNDKQVQELIRMMQREDEERAARRALDTRVTVTAHGSGSGGGSGGGGGGDADTDLV